MNWHRGTTGDYSTVVGTTRYKLRWVRLAGGRKVWWVYVNESRYTSTGRFADAVSFAKLADARRFVVGLLTNA